jgi:hypothetical protein
MFVFPNLSFEISVLIDEFVKVYKMSVPIISFTQLYQQLHTEYKKDFEELFAIGSNATIRYVSLLFAK